MGLKNDWSLKQKPHRVKFWHRNTKTLIKNTSRVCRQLWVLRTEIFRSNDPGKIRLLLRETTADKDIGLLPSEDIPLLWLNLSRIWEKPWIYLFIFVSMVLSINCSHLYPLSFIIFSYNSCFDLLICLCEYSHKINSGTNFRLIVCTILMFCISYRQLYNLLLPW